MVDADERGADVSVFDIARLQAVGQTCGEPGLVAVLIPRQQGGLLDELFGAVVDDFVFLMEIVEGI